VPAEVTETCGVKSKAKWNFMRDWYCSLAPGHDGPHIAYPNNERPASMADVCWIGPWEDDRPHPTLAEFAAEHNLRIVGHG
jgi:hypothetical protein